MGSSAPSEQAKRGRGCIDVREFHGVSLDGVHQVPRLADRPAAHSATATGHPLVRFEAAIRKGMRLKSDVVRVTLLASAGDSAQGTK
jgi:hypothetical protein